ncbi:ICEBs1 excisionase [Bacillus subtilis]|uniref:ICEBs1 excisionase n=1 Tax=Bacillus subtilis group TaxID=653685 RepID=UPI00142F73D7|nr:MULTISPECIES: ICEBs1 excisionase [Bacillus subtilis group]MEC1645145.1 ICEBs1 excisionase [Bacillus halotolerans]MEC3675490.1 ICEBs1 excisionase [Bacillus velezensis]MED1779992.1 ICEBs1 excisionase [Bacillus subtilis]NJF07315.1 ICEBs1 excisionase [Bacillus subtilis]
MIIRIFSGGDNLNEFLTAKDIQNILGVKQAKAYEIIRSLNKEMENDGYMVIQGKVNRAKFEERYCYKSRRQEQDDHYESKPNSFIYA